MSLLPLACLPVLAETLGAGLGTVRECQLGVTRRAKSGGLGRLSLSRPASLSLAAARLMVSPSTTNAY